MDIFLILQIIAIVVGVVLVAIGICTDSEIPLIIGVVLLLPFILNGDVVYELQVFK